MIGRLSDKQKVTATFALAVSAVAGSTMAAGAILALVQDHKKIELGEAVAGYVRANQPVLQSAAPTEISPETLKAGTTGGDSAQGKVLQKIVVERGGDGLDARLVDGQGWTFAMVHCSAQKAAQTEAEHGCQIELLERVR
jgi:hypothetical protein